MSYRHLSIIAELEIPPQQKLVLYQIGNLACEDCGLAWPGMTYLAKKTRLGEKSIASAIRELKHGRFLDVTGYSRGGRGRTTQYVVLAAYLELGNAPCATCVENLKTGAARAKPLKAAGVSGEKPLTPAGVSDGNSFKPPLSAHRNPSRETDYTINNNDTTTRARAREEEPSASPPVNGSPEMNQSLADKAEAAMKRLTQGSIPFAPPAPRTDAAEAAESEEGDTDRE